MLAGSNTQGIFRTTNNGNNWSLVNISGTNFGVINFCRNNEGYIWAATTLGILISKDQGASWDFANTGLPAKGVYSIAINNDDILYALGRDSILYYSLNYGSLWLSYKNTPKLTWWGPFIIKVNSRNYLFLTNYNCIFYSNNPVTDVNPEEFSSAGNLSGYTLIQNYPNPFNPSTIITFELPQTEFVTLKLYDVLGKEIRTLVSEEKPAGTHEIEFNGSGLNSGIYFYRIECNELNDVKKMILLK